MRSPRLITVMAAVAIAAGGLALPAAAAAAGSTPESLTLLSTTPVHVTSSTGKALLLSIGAIRFAADPKSSDLHSKGSVTVTLSNLTTTESHAWTFRIAPDSFETTAVGTGHLKTGNQIAPYGAVKATVVSLRPGDKQQCGADNFQVHHKVTVKGQITLDTQSSGPDSWGTVDAQTSLHGTLTAGHGADNEEACATIPCVGGITWIANKGPLALSGQDVARKGKKSISTIDANRFVHLGNPAHATRTDEVMTKAPAPTLSMLNGKKTLSVTTKATGPAAGDAALSAPGRSRYAQGCSTGQETGKLWSARYVTADLPLTFSEDIFGPLSIIKTKSADFEKYHVT